MNLARFLLLVDFLEDRLQQYVAVPASFQDNRMSGLMFSGDTEVTIFREASNFSTITHGVAEESWSPEYSNHELVLESHKCRQKSISPFGNK